MGSFTVKLCDGFRLYNGVMKVLETEDWQEVREWLSLDAKSEDWKEITRNVFACGYCKLIISDNEGRQSNIYIEAIPCAN